MQQALGFVLASLNSRYKNGFHHSLRMTWLLADHVVGEAVCQSLSESAGSGGTA